MESSCGKVKYYSIKTLTGIKQLDDKYELNNMIVGILLFPDFVEKDVFVVILHHFSLNSVGLLFL